MEVFWRSVPIENVGAGSFFTDDVAKNLLRELGEEPDRLTRDTPSGRREPVPHVDMPVSQSLKQVLASVAKIARKRDSKTIEPLHLLAAIVEERDSKLAQHRDHGVTPQKVAQALDAVPRLAVTPLRFGWDGSPSRKDSGGHFNWISAHSSRKTADDSPSAFPLCNGSYRCAYGHHRSQRPAVY